jgi:hypothetical protein
MADQFDSKEFQEVLDTYTEHLAQGIPISEELAQKLKDLSTGIKDYTKNLKASKEALMGSLKSLGMSMINGESGAAVYNDTISKGAKTFSSWASKFPRVGKALGGVAEAAAAYTNAVADQADALFKSYQDISRSGIATGMNDAFKNLQDAGYTMKEIGQYGQLMKENSAVLATMGGTTAQGAAEFAKVSKNIKNSQLETQFMRMGMTVNDINSGIANYVKQQQLSGSTLQQNDKQITASAAEFIVEQDKITKLTGLSADQQNKIYEGALAQEQFAAKTFQLQLAAAAGDEQAKAELKRNKEMVAQITSKFGPEVAKGAQLYIAGAMNSQGAQKFQRTFSELADDIDKGGTDVGRSMNIMTREADTLVREQSRLGLVGAFNNLFLPIQEVGKGASASTQDFAKATKEATKSQKDQIAAKDAATGAMVDTTRDQRDITQSFDHVINVGVPLVTKGLSGLSGVTQQLTSVFGQLAGKEGQIGGGTTLLNKLGIGKAPAPSATGGAAAGGAAAGGAAAGGAAASGPSGVATPPVVTPITPPAGKEGAANVDALIKFTGGTGDKTHFQQLNPSVLNSFVQMASAYFNSTGKKLQVNSAFRSVEEQANVNSGTNPKAAPGKSLHNLGKAVDINSSQVSELQSSGLLGQHGFSPLANDPPHIQMPSAALGGILSGPKSGYQAMLHGNEAVVPLPDGKTIPVQNSGGSGSSEQTNLLAMELGKLESLLGVMQKQNDITNKILAKQS